MMRSVTGNTWPSLAYTLNTHLSLVSTDPDISGGLSDGLLSGDFAATNLGMAGGQVRTAHYHGHQWIINVIFQWIFFFLVWMGFLFTNSSSVQARSAEAADRQLGTSEVMRSVSRVSWRQVNLYCGLIYFSRALDDLLTPSTVTKQTVVNVLGVRSWKKSTKQQEREIFKFAFPGKFLQTNRNVRDYYYYYYDFWQTYQFATYFLLFFATYFLSIL